MKECFKCHAVLPLTEFYDHPAMGDGKLGKCKNCTRADSRMRYETKRKDLAWVMRERERCRLKQEAYRTRGFGGASNTARKKWWSNNKSKIKAEHTARHAWRTGKILKPEFCQSCKATARLEMHHPDYTKPLAVMWLCSKCHGITRRKQTL